MITRHYLDVGSRRVHYRRAGHGPLLLLVHQSPRSSAEYLPLLERWSAHFTCIAPDTAGFGQSDPLPLAPERSDIGAFADSVIAFLDAAGIRRTAAYGFHSGGMILASALRRHPERFSALAIGGYGVWTEAERQLPDRGYLPPLQPSAYGEHLTWLWNRVLEQSWFFPWFETTPAHRLSVAHDDPARVDAIVRELLDAGDSYRAGYGAVLRSPYELPDASAAVPPAQITAYNGDPLQAHLRRLQPLPAGWQAFAVDTVAAHQAEALAFLQRHATDGPPPIPEANDGGFLKVQTGVFEGLIHWCGQPGSETVTLHAPGEALELEEQAALAIDLPGHGLSDDWTGQRPTHWPAWQQVIDAAGRELGFRRQLQAPAPKGDPERLFPDLAADRFGSHLTKAWSIIRAGRLFSPWYEAQAGHARTFSPEALAPERLAIAHRALLRAAAARALLQAQTSVGA